MVRQAQPVVELVKDSGLVGAHHQQASRAAAAPALQPPPLDPPEKKKSSKQSVPVSSRAPGNFFPPIAPVVLSPAPGGSESEGSSPIIHPSFASFGVASPPVRVVHDATDALADDMASHGQRLNPRRLSEQRRAHVAVLQYHGDIGLSGEDLADPNRVSPRTRAREDPVAAVGGLAKPSPYALLHTISTGLLPHTPHVTPAPLREMRSGDFDRHEGAGSGEVAQKWLRQVASEAQLYRRPQRKRTKIQEVLRPLHTALEVHCQREYSEGMDEPTRLTGRTRLYAASILESIMPKVGALDSQLGMALQTSFSELATLTEQFGVVATRAHARAERAASEQARVEDELRASRAESDRWRADADRLSAEATTRQTESMKARAEAAELTRQINRAEEDQETDREARNEAVLAAREAKIQLKRIQKETAGQWNKSLEVREKYEASLLSEAQAHERLGVVESELAALDEKMETMALSDNDRMRILRQEARGFKKDLEEVRYKCARDQHIAEEAMVKADALQAQHDTLTSMHETAAAGLEKAQGQVTLLSAKLMRAKREGDAAETTRLMQDDELNALRMQVMTLKAQLARSEEARTEAYAKLNGVFHGDEAQWMVRELLLADEIIELEELQTTNGNVTRKLRLAKKETQEMQLEIKELTVVENQLQRRLDETTAKMRLAEQDAASKGREIDKYKKSEVRMLDATGKAKLRMQAAEAALSEAEASYMLGARRRTVEVAVLKTTMRDLESELSGKADIVLPPPKRQFDPMASGKDGAPINAQPANTGMIPRAIKRRSSCAMMTQAAAAAAAAAAFNGANPSANSSGSPDASSSESPLPTLGGSALQKSASEAVVDSGAPPPRLTQRRRSLSALPVPQPGGGRRGSIR